MKIYSRVKVSGQGVKNMQSITWGIMTKIYTNDPPQIVKDSTMSFISNNNSILGSKNASMISAIGQSSSLNNKSNLSKKVILSYKNIYKIDTLKMQSSNPANTLWISRDFTEVKYLLKFI